MPTSKRSKLFGGGANLGLVLELRTGPFFISRLFLRHGGVALDGEAVTSVLEVPATRNAGSQTAAAREKRGSEMREARLVSGRRSWSEWN